MDESILLEIKKAEERAEQVLREAEAKRDRMLKESQIEAAKSKEKEIEKQKALLEKFSAEQAQKTEKEAGAIMGTASENAKKIKVDPKKAEEAKAFLKKELDELLSGKHVLSGKNV